MTTPSTTVQRGRDGPEAKTDVPLDYAPGRELPRTVLRVLLAANAVFLIYNSTILALGLQWSVALSVASIVTGLAAVVALSIVLHLTKGEPQ